MIVVKIELWSAQTGERREIGRTYISNTGGTMKLRNYGVAVCRRGSHDLENQTRSGYVNHFPSQSYNVWRLVIRALLSAFPEEQRHA